MSRRYMLIPAIWLAVFVFWSWPASAQNALWSRTYGGNSAETCYSVRQTTDGGYIAAGRTMSFGAGGYDAYLIKTDSLGDTLWTRTYGGIYDDWAYSVQQTADGGYIAAGRTWSSDAGAYDAYLIKTDSLGDTLWTRTYGGIDYDHIRGAQQTTDGGYIAAGLTESFGAGDADVYLIKTDSLGGILWSRTYGGIYGEGGWGAQQTTDAGYIVAGYTGSFDADVVDVYLIKTDSLGDILWTRTYGGTDLDFGWSFQQTADGGYIVTGTTYSFGGGEDIYLIKTDSLGNTLWTRTYGGIDVEDGCSVQQTTDGGYIVAGFAWSFGAGIDIYLIKTNSLGDILWTRTCGGLNYDYGWGVDQTTDGGYIVTGETWSFGAGGTDVILTKLDSLGNTCIGESVPFPVMTVAFSVTSPPTEVTSPPTVVTSPPTTVTSPAVEVTIVCMRVCGDATGDGVVDLDDVVFLSHYLFMYGPAPDPLEAGDVDCDEVIDVADVIYLINYVLKEGPLPCC